MSVAATSAKFAAQKLGQPVSKGMTSVVAEQVAKDLEVAVGKMTPDALQLSGKAALEVPPQVIDSFLSRLHPKARDAAFARIDAHIAQQEAKLQTILKPVNAAKTVGELDAATKEALLKASTLSTFEVYEHRFMSKPFSPVYFQNQEQVAFVPRTTLQKEAMHRIRFVSSLNRNHLDGSKERSGELFKARFTPERHPTIAPQVDRPQYVSIKSEPAPTLYGDLKKWLNKPYKPFLGFPM